MATKTTSSAAIAVNPDIFTLSMYLHNKNKRESATYVSGNIKKYYLDGAEFTRAEMDALYPITGQITFSYNLRKIKGVNCDKTKI